jgi:hypothetical protein
VLRIIPAPTPPLGVWLVETTTTRR